MDYENMDRQELVDELEAKSEDLKWIEDVIDRFDDLDDRMDMDSAITLIRNTVKEGEQ